MNYKNLTPAYQKKFNKKLEELWWSIGTIYYNDELELGWILNLPYDNRINECLRRLYAEDKIVWYKDKNDIYTLDWLPF
jgi:hypothetical protein